MKTSFQISPIQSLYVTKQTLNKKTLEHLKYFLAQTWNFTWNLQKCQIFILNLKTSFPHTSNFNVETFNNSKNSFAHTFSNFTVKSFNISKNFLTHIFSNFKVETFNNLKNSFAHTFSNFTIKSFNNSKNSFASLIMCVLWGLCEQVL